jgi:hypothetical protein
LRARRSRRTWQGSPTRLETRISSLQVPLKHRDGYPDAGLGTAGDAALNCDSDSNPMAGTAFHQMRREVTGP